jgi:diaminohydroxyphosphoribosylaminopyrimidine deaminase/5-amino-6-(5-phosphoribosylamino)uracil reductase
MAPDRDADFMRQALREALRGRGRTSPNPLVGSVIVKRGQIISRGYHSFFGGPHAEIRALSKLPEGRAEGATLYVNLEPCCYYGKTPPCTKALIAAGIRRVVVGCIDPNPLVSGEGVAELKSAGIEVVSGVMEEEARTLNAPYFTFVTKKRPWVLLKMAQTLDGRMGLASGDSRWITGEAARREVHRLRSRLDGVLVGIHTVLQDDPELTVRLVRGRNPFRFILDSHLRIPLPSRVLHQPEPEKTIVFTTQAASQEKRKAIEGTGARVLETPADTEHHVDIRAALEKMAQLGIMSLLVEGGGTVHRSFLLSECVDSLTVAVAPKLIGDDGKASVGALGLKSLAAAPEFVWKRTRRLGNDFWLELDNVHRTD